MDVPLAAKSHKAIRVNEVTDMASTAFSTILRSHRLRRAYRARDRRRRRGLVLRRGLAGLLPHLPAADEPAIDAEQRQNVDYLREGETIVSREYPLAPLSRLTVDLSTDEALANRSFGISVYFDAPGAAERAMYFGDSPLFNGGHESAGVNEASKTWFLAEGATGPFFETFVLLANPNSADAEVTLTYLPSTGSPITAHAFLRDSGSPVIKQFEVRPTSRFNVPVGPGTSVRELNDEHFGALIESDQPIAVERALYWDANGKAWAAGTNATATRLP
jgi:hypothetical protein